MNVKPHKLNENLPLDFINQQLEHTLDELKQGKTIDLPWLIQQEVIESTWSFEPKETLYHALPASEQETLWFDGLLSNVDVQDKEVWLTLLDDPAFMNKLVGNPQYLEKLSVLNWRCPADYFQQQPVAPSRNHHSMFSTTEPLLPSVPADMNNNALNVTNTTLNPRPTIDLRHVPMS